LEDNLDSTPYTREPIWPAPEFSQPPLSAFERFKLASGNEQFRKSILTYVSLVFLLFGYPGVSLLGAGEDPTAMLKNMSQGTLIFLLVSTVAFQWVMFLMLFVSLYRERTGLGGLGLKRIRLVDFGWALAFLLSANLVLSGLAWFLGQIGLPMPGEVGLLVPKDPSGRVLWVVVAMTAGFCEEVAFRGYLMTRLRLFSRLNSWLVPVILSSLAFGVCHAYQGWPGLIVISVYGSLFALLYIRTGRLWPCIIAHFLQDFSGLFFPH
jgi:membrane protease YdiL (CAAX protease family)